MPKPLASETANAAMTPVFRQGPPQAQVQLPDAPFQEQFSPNGELWAQFHRIASGYLLRFPGLADFELSADGRAVLCIPVEGTSDGSIQHLFLNQVVPLALSRAGRLMFHASAVSLGAGCAVFMGESGRGKSTLAASFAAAGYPFLTDDALTVDSHAFGCTVLPSHPSIRLWDDSRAALAIDSAPVAPAVQFTRKARMLAGESLPFCDAATRLGCVYFLGPGTAIAAEIEPLSAGAALVEMLRNSFVLDIDCRETLAWHFDKLAALAQLPVFYRLDYPRAFEQLALVRRAIVEHVSAQAKSELAGAGDFVGANP